MVELAARLPYGTCRKRLNATSTSTAHGNDNASMLLTSTCIIFRATVRGLEATTAHLSEGGGLHGNLGYIFKHINAMLRCLGYF